MRGVTVYDDFAHHPTAIATTVGGLRGAVGAQRIIAVLEPRSNTMKLGTMNAALPGSLREADHTFCYAARNLGWDAGEALAPLGYRVNVHDDLDRMVDAIAAFARTGDHVLVMSNGGFGGVHGKILAALAKGSDFPDRIRVRWRPGAVDPFGDLLYLHGFRSSPASVKASQVAAAVESLPATRRPRLHIPMLDVGPASADGDDGRVDRVERCAAACLADDHRQLARRLLCDASRGAFRRARGARQSGDPSVRRPAGVRRSADQSVHRRDVRCHPRTFRGARALAVARITRPERYWLMVQTGDEVLDYREAIVFYGGAFQYVQGGGDHAFQRFDAQIPAVLRFAGVAVA